MALTENSVVPFRVLSEAKRSGENAPTIYTEQLQGLLVYKFGTELMPMMNEIHAVLPLNDGDIVELTYPAHIYRYWIERTELGMLAIEIH